MGTALALLQAPETAPPDCLASVLRARDQFDGDFVLIAAAIYARPRLLPPDLPARVTGLFAEPALPPRTATLAREVLEFLLATPLAPAVVEQVVALATQPGLSAHAYTELCAFLEYAAWWACPLLDAAALVTLAEAAHLLPHRDLLCRRVLEPALYSAGASLRPATLERACRLLAAQPGLPHLLYRIARWQQFSAAVREAAQAATPNFPYHHEAARRLAGDGHRILVVHNIKDGQGDEIVRWVPLVQAFLDGNPRLTAVVVSGRLYLAAHPRVTAVPIADRQAVAELLRQPFDAVLDFFEPVVPSLNHDVDLESRLQEYVWARRPFLFASSRKGFDCLFFERADLDGLPIAESRGLNTQATSVYEPAARLIAELGLPLRSGEDAPASEFVLAGIEWPAARAAWRALVGGNTGARPVALFNPFGGNRELKGFVEQTLPAAAAEIERLTAEGYFVVLLPNGTAWGSAQSALDLANRLSPECRRHTATAPDPADPAAAQQVHHDVPGAPPLLHQDYVTRQFLYFARYADLIVTIEGWLVHTAWCLGKPYRVLYAPYCQREPWSPYARTARQGIQRLPAPAGWLDPAAPPPLVEQPRKFVLTFLLREVGKSADPAFLPLLRKVATSRDHDLRRAAVGALAGFPPADTAADLRRALHDPWNGVRAVAAEALLQCPDAGPIPQAELLGHFYIGHPKGSDWKSALALGEAALPAIRAAMEDDDEVVRREAEDARRRLDQRHQIEQTILQNPSASAGIPEVLRLLLTPRADLVPPPATRPGTVLILTPVKDAAALFDGYCERLRGLTYPRDAISLGFLESDSRDATFRTVSRQVRRLRKEFRRAALWKRDFGYRIPRGIHRGSEPIQRQRRAVLARSRNHLLSHALDDEEWVLWLDVDVVEYPPDIIQRLLATGKDLVQPHCVLDHGGPTFDCNAWAGQGCLHLDDLRSQGDLVELDAVGGTMLLVRADLHRDGLVFPPFPYGRPNPRIREGRGGELETEGLGIMAQDMGHRCWGMPNLEILHGKW